MTTQQIQYILEVYQTKSMSKAAANLYVAQPNISSSIRALEYELGFPIFKRTKHGVLPTENGILVLKYARRVWDHYQKMRQINSGIQYKRLHVGGVPISAVYRAFEHLCLHYQQDEYVDLTYDSPSFLDPDSFILSDYDIQLGLMLPRDVDAFIKKSLSKGVLVTPLKDIPIVLRIGPNHPLYHKADAIPADFSSYILVDYMGGIYQDYPELDHFLAINPKRVVSVGDRTTKHCLVAQGSFVSLGCKLPADMDKMYGFRNISLGDMRYTLVIMEEKGKKRSAVAGEYIQYLLKELDTV